MSPHSSTQKGLKLCSTTSRCRHNQLVRRASVRCAAHAECQSTRRYAQQAHSRKLPMNEIGHRTPRSRSKTATRLQGSKVRLLVDLESQNWCSLTRMGLDLRVFVVTPGLAVPLLSLSAGPFANLANNDDDVSKEEDILGTLPGPPHGPGSSRAHYQKMRLSPPLAMTHCEPASPRSITLWILTPVSRNQSHPPN